MQNPNEDTQWNDALRAKGILPPKEEPTITEDDVVKVDRMREKGGECMLCYTIDCPMVTLNKCTNIIL